MTINRNNMWRIQRSAKHLEKALDSLSRAGGELRPRELADLRKSFDTVMRQTERLHEQMETLMRQPGQARQLDLDDLDDDTKEAAE